MPSKRRTTRTAQLHPQPAPPSDYDTDTNATDTVSASMASAPPKRTTAELNMTVLQRYISDLENIIAIAPFAVIYTFSPDSGEWEKCNIEGTLFVCQLTGGRYNVVVLNRKSLSNFLQDLTSPDDVEDNEEYIILQVLGEDGAPQIFGLWIYSEPGIEPSMRDSIAQIIQDCARLAQAIRDGRADVQAELHDGQYEDPPGDHNAIDVSQQSCDRPTGTETSGQPLDLLSLFGKSGSQPAQASIQRTNVASPLQYPQTYRQSTDFASTADTDFFRGSSNPAAAQQENRQGLSMQQNALLNSFKR